MSKKLYGTISEDNYTYVKEVIRFENWDRILNEFIESRAKEQYGNRKTKDNS